MSCSARRAVPAPQRRTLACWGMPLLWCGMTTPTPILPAQTRTCSSWVYTSMRSTEVMWFSTSAVCLTIHCKSPPSCSDWVSASPASRASSCGGGEGRET